ncbi:MAG: gliding motility-associated C-terminal domain-containing protein [Flavobacteriales bacterium]
MLASNDPVLVRLTLFRRLCGTSRPNRLEIISTYNELENIRDNIAFVLPLEPPIQVLLVDDGSPGGIAEICIGETITLDAGNHMSSYLWLPKGDTYLWHPDGQTTRTIDVYNDGLYTVDLTTPENCSISQDIVVNENCLSTLFMPNSFTPNDDGQNEVFMPQGWNVASMELYIFDRWGNIIRHGMDADASWDGTWKGGEPCEVGVYTWKLIYSLYLDAEKTNVGDTQQLFGHVTLLR